MSAMHALTDELHAVVTRLEAEEHHLAAEARAVYERLHAEIVKAAHALTGHVPDTAPKGQADTPAKPPTGS